MNNRRSKICSRDGELEVLYSDIQNVCICVVNYPLIQYLLLEDLDVCKYHTIYILDESIHATIREKLPSYTFLTSTHSFFDRIFRKFRRSFLAITRNLRHPYLKTATLYAQDHDIVSILIGKHNYYLLSDGPDILTRYYSPDNGVRLRNVAKANSLQGKLEKFIYGTPFIHPFGGNSQCKRIYMTEQNSAPVMQGKEIFVNSFQELWEKAPDEKKRFVRYVFDITDDDIIKMESKPIIFFTQPVVDDRILTKDEYIEVLNKIFNHYDLSQIMIKTHPRDKFDYHKYFSNIEVFNKPINIQLLTLLNLSFKKAVTLFSTAVLDLPENIEVDWIGANIHPKLLAFTVTDETPARCHRITL